MRQLVDRSLHSFVVLWISALLVKVPLSLALGLIALAGKWAWRGYGWVDEHIPAPPCPKRWSAEERIRRQNEEWNRKHNPSHHDGAAPAPSVDGVVGMSDLENKKGETR